MPKDDELIDTLPIHRRRVMAIATRCSREEIGVQPFRLASQADGPDRHHGRPGGMERKQSAYTTGTAGRMF